MDFIFEAYKKHGIEVPGEASESLTIFEFMHRLSAGGDFRWYKHECDGIRSNLESDKPTEQHIVDVLRASALWSNPSKLCAQVWVCSRIQGSSVVCNHGSLGRRSGAVVNQYSSLGIIRAMFPRESFKAGRRLVRIDFTPFSCVA